jgi:hypothetical protein
MSRAFQHLVAIGFSAIILFYIAECQMDSVSYIGNSVEAITTSQVVEYLLTAFVCSIGFPSLAFFPAAWIIERWARRRRFLTFILPITFPVALSAFFLTCLFLLKSSILLMFVWDAFLMSIAFFGYCCILWLVQLVVYGFKKFTEKIQSMEPIAVVV